MDDLFPTLGSAAPVSGLSSLVSSPDQRPETSDQRRSPYRCSTSDDCAEQLRILRYVETCGPAGATTEEIAVACNVSDFRLAPTIEWMIDRDAFLRWAFAPRGPIRTAVLFPTHRPV